MRTSKLSALFLLIAGLGGVTLKAQVLTVKSVGSVRHGADTQVTVVFSEPVEQASATTLVNYTFTGGVTVSSASLMTGLPAADLQGNVENPAPTGRVQDNECVVLTVTGLAPGAAASITIQNVKDRLVPQNTVPTTTINFTDSGYTWGDTGTPTLDGRVIVVGTNGFDIFSAGAAQWANYDEVTLVYKQTTGDFDYKARVEFQDFSSQWARAGIMAREALNFGENAATQVTTASRYVDMHANPVMSWDSGGTGGFINANNGFESHFRNGGTLQGVLRGTDSTGAGTPVYPNAWVRIVRETNTFRTYRGADGQNWTLQATRNTTTDTGWATPMAASIFLGPGFGVETANINGSNPSAAFNRRFLYQVRFTAITVPYVTGVEPHPSSVIVRIQDGGVTQVNTNTIQLTFDGNPVPTTATKIGGTTVVAYKAASPFPIGSPHTIVLTFSDTAGGSQSFSRSFVIPSYTIIPGAYAVAGVDTSAVGLSARIHQIRRPRSPGDANTIAMAERQLAGGFIDPTTGLPYENTIIPGSSGPAPDDPDGIHNSLDVINWNEFGSQASCTASSGTNGTDIGNFQGGFGTTFTFPNDVQDTEIPGLFGCIDTSNPDAGGYNDNMVVETIAYLDLPAGSYTFGVNSDDGFKVSVAPGVGDVLGLTLGSFNGGRGASDTLFDLYVPTSGIYPVRLLWWEGGGGANCEFFYVDLSTGQKVLVNDSPVVTHWATGAPVGASAVKAYKGTATASVKRPYVSRVTPEAGKPEAANTGNGAQSGQLYVFADADVKAWITDGTITVTPSSVSLIVNGTTYTGATKSGGVTTVSRPGSVASLLPAGVNNAAVVYSYTDGGSTVTFTNSWIFTVVPYTVIPAANAVPAASLNLADTGFKEFIHQIDRTLDTNFDNGTRITGGSDVNRMPWPEVQLVGGNINPTNGTAYPNLAQQGANNWTYDLTSINFNSNPANGATGVIVGDGSMPGMPGNGTTVTGGIRGIENVAAEYRTYLNLAAGAYLFAVNSDDGFVCTSGPDPHDTLGTLLGFANFGRGNNSPLPAPPATLPVPTPGSGNGNSTFQVIVPQAGYYPFRILFWQGGGGINMEFLSIDKASGLQVAVNSTNTAANATNFPPVQAYRTYTGSARPWTRFSVSPTPWDNRHQQGGPGPILMYGRTQNAANAGDINNSANDTRPFADVLGGVIANGASDPTLALLVNGTPVAATFTTNGNDVTVRYKTPLPSGSTNTASLVYGGTSNSWSFVVQTYTSLNASAALAESDADPNARGFLVKMFQATNGQPNTVTRAENQIAGIITPNVANAGPGPNGSYIYTNVINWNNNRNTGHTGVEIGNFQTNANWTGWPYATYPDEALPGIPGTGVATNYTDNIAAEIFAYWDFPAAGYYRLGVNSDDGFAIKVGTPGVTNGTTIASIDVGKGSSDIPVSVSVPQAGLYPIRLVYYNGGGGANLEFFSYDDTGKKIPINDRNDPTAIKAYYQVTTVAAPMFTSATVSGGTLTINWNPPSSGTLTLQQAAVVRGLPGDFSDVPGVVGTSYSVPVNAAAQKFYRLKQQ